MSNKKKVPEVSVAIPSYNRAHLLPNAIKSILKQSVKDVEIIIADDGSTDNPEELIKGLQKKYPIIIYVKSPVNMGEAATRNLAIQNATGKYLAFLDSDDEWLPGKLKAQIDFLEKKSNYDAVSTNYFLVDQAGKRSRSQSWFTKFELTALNLLKKGCDISAGSTMVVRREVFEKIGFFDELLPIFVDLDWLCRFCDAGGKMGKVEECLVLYNKAPMRTGLFLELGVKAFKKKNSLLLKRFSLINRAHIESQFYEYISHAYLVNGPFSKFFYTRCLCLFLRPLVNVGNYKHLFFELFRYMLGKKK